MLTTVPLLLTVKPLERVCQRMVQAQAGPVRSCILVVTPFVFPIFISSTQQLTEEGKHCLLHIQAWVKPVAQLVYRSLECCLQLLECSLQLALLTQLAALATV